MANVVSLMNFIIYYDDGSYDSKLVDKAGTCTSGTSNKKDTNF